MIQARHTWLGKQLARYYAGYRLDTAFRPVRYFGDWPDNGLPILLLANHFSWWDGFIQYRLNRRLFNRKFHVMMLEEQLRRHPLLSRMGAFSIRKGTRQILDSLLYASGVLTDPHNLVLLFPQGKIDSLHTPTFRFEKGAEYLLNHASQPIQVVFNINLVDYFSAKRPSLSVYYKPYDFFRPVSSGQLEKAFNEYAEDCKSQQRIRCTH